MLKIIATMTLALLLALVPLRAAMADEGGEATTPITDSLTVFDGSD